MQKLNDDPFAHTLLRRLLEEQDNDHGPFAGTLLDPALWKPIGLNPKDGQGTLEMPSEPLPSKDFVNGVVPRQQRESLLQRIGQHTKEESSLSALTEAYETQRIESLNRANLALARMSYQQNPWPLEKLVNSRYLHNLLKFPKIAENEMRLASDPDMRIAWGILADCFYLWLTNEAAGESDISPEPYFVRWEWATAHEVAQAALKNLEANLFNDAAKAVLENRFLNEGYDKLDGTIPFDYTALPPSEWHSRAYQYRAVNHYGLSALLNNPLSTPQYIALGDYDIRAVPTGFVRKLPHNRHEICVNDIHLLVYDTFNFEGTELLGLWDFNNLRYDSLSPFKQLVDNGDFREFRRATGFGRNFRVVSPLKKIEGFVPYCWEAPW